VCVCVRVRVCVCVCVCVCVYGVRACVYNILRQKSTPCLHRRSEQLYTTQESNHPDASDPPTCSKHTHAHAATLLGLFQPPNRPSTTRTRYSKYDDSKYCKYSKYGIDVVRTYSVAQCHRHMTGTPQPPKHYTDTMQ
jgi:hypothetical protein